MTTRSLAGLYTAQNWVFDLDNTLYSAESDLFSQIDARMTDFVGRYLNLDPETARARQKHYYSTYGTTLNGMMVEHNMPARAFLDYVHDLDYTPIAPNPALRAAIEALPGRKLVFTNGSHGHAERTLKALGMEGVFSDLFDIEATKYQPKPKREAFDALIEATNLNPEKSVMVEDLSRNLVTAHALGFATVLVWSHKDWSHEPEGARPAGPVAETPDHIHHMTDNLAGFLEAVIAEGTGGVKKNPLSAHPS
jgi:putative hydrolase of the HAD superfamily